MTLWDVHTVPAPGQPIRHYQQYADQPTAQRMAAHLVGVLGCPLVVEAVDEQLLAGLLAQGRWSV